MNGGIIGVPNASKSGLWRLKDVLLNVNHIRFSDVTYGLLHRWPLTENANDVVGTLNLTNNGSVTFSSNGASFNGSNQSLTGTATWPSNFTATAWIKFSTSSVSYAFGAANAAGENGFSPVIDSDVFLSVYGGTLKIYSGRNLADSTWHLIGVEGHSTGAVEWKFYIDGALEGSGTPASFTLDTNFALGRLGAYAYGYYFAGNEIDARIFDKALTAGQHATLYANGPNP
mgnify:CR=1 FL=1